MGEGLAPPTGAASMPSTGDGHQPSDGGNQKICGRYSNSKQNSGLHGR